MFNKIYEYTKKDIKQNWKIYLIFLLIVPWFFIPFDYNIYTPGGLIELTDRIEIDSEYKSEGSFNMTYVSAKKGVLPVILLSYIIPGWDLVSLEESRIDNESESDIIKRNQIYLEETSYDAIIASFSAANKPYEITNIDVTVSHIFEYATSDLELGDIIKTINDKQIKNFEDLKSVISSLKKGDKVSIKVQRKDKIIDCYAIITEYEGQNVIGISLTELKEIKTDPEVEFIFKNNEAGSSRGLMCALEIYNRITQFDLTKGDIISGTGSIDSEGNVGAISGVKYKLSGAVKEKAKVFIVPDANYEEAITLKEEKDYDIEIIKADTLENVIKQLKNRK